MHNALIISWSTSGMPECPISHSKWVSHRRDWKLLDGILHLHSYLKQALVSHITFHPGMASNHCADFSEIRHKYLYSLVPRILAVLQHPWIMIRDPWRLEICTFGIGLQMIKQKMLECIKRGCVHAQKIIQYKIMSLAEIVQLLIDCILLIFYNRLEN